MEKKENLSGNIHVAVESGPFPGDILGREIEGGAVYTALRNGHKFLCCAHEEPGRGSVRNQVLNESFQAISREESLFVSNLSVVDIGLLKTVCQANGYVVKVYNPFHEDSNSVNLLDTWITNDSLSEASEGYFSAISQIITEDVLRRAAPRLPAIFHTPSFIGNCLRSDLRNHGNERLPKILSKDYYNRENSPAEIADYVCRDDIDLTLPAREKCAYLIAAPDSSTKRILSGLFVYSFLENVVAYIDSTRERKATVPINVIVDGDTVLLEKNAGFERKIATVRSRNISITIAINDCLKTKFKMGLADKDMESFWMIVFANCAEFIYYGSNSPLTADDDYKELIGFISSLCGQETVSVNGTLCAGHCISQEEIANLKEWECIVFLNAMKPLRLAVFQHDLHPLCPHTLDGEN